MSAEIEVVTAPGEAYLIGNQVASAALYNTVLKQCREAEAEAQRWVAMLERMTDQHMRFGVIQPDGTTEMQACADWCYACKIERMDALREYLETTDDDGIRTREIGLSILGPPEE